jgi:hypothetical protein
MRIWVSDGEPIGERSSTLILPSVGYLILRPYDIFSLGDSQEAEMKSEGLKQSVLVMLLYNLR